MQSASIESAIERIRAFARSKGWAKSRLAKEAGMADTVLRRLDERDWNPTADTLRQLEAIIPPDFAAPAPQPAKRQKRKAAA